MRMTDSGRRALGLASLELKLRYRSDEDDLANEFYIPCLEESVRYDRAVGFFTAQSLNLIARGIAGLIKNDGSMRLVIDPLLSPEDVEQIKRGYDQRLDQVLVEKLKASLAKADEMMLKRVEALAWLIGAGKLDIKVAVRIGEEHLPVPYLYHEKWGVFIDKQGEAVAFTGSANETPEGLRDNFEAIDVYASWSGEDSKARIRLKQDDFERLWRNETRGLRVLEFPEAARKELLKLRPPKPPTQDPEFRPLRCPKCLGPLERSRIRLGIPVCSSCGSFLPLRLVGFERYIIEGCRVQVVFEGSPLTGRVLSVDYGQPSYEVLTDDGKRLFLKERLQRITFKTGQKVLANGVPAVVMAHSVREDNGRLSYTVLLGGEEHFIPEEGVEPSPPSVEDQIRSLVIADPQRWDLHILATFIESAPYMKNGEALLTASSKVKPYEHQLTVSGRIVNTVPPRFLLADEVGLGKTIEVGLALKELQMRGLIDRVLVVAPKLLVGQWIGELGRRFNLFFREVTADEYADAAKRGTNPFNEVNFAITSYQLVERVHRRKVLLDAKPWDMIVVDEAHHIRRDPLKREKNELFKLVDGWEEETSMMEGLKEKCEGLLLVTATPLQLRIEELYDLLSIVGLGGRWAIPDYFARFFEDVVVSGSGSLPLRVEMARDFLSWAEYDRQMLNREIASATRYASKIQEIIFGGGTPTFRDLQDKEFVGHLSRILTFCTPLRWLMFRNTRNILRGYGLYVPKRYPRDHLFPLGRPDEEEIYEELTKYIQHFYEKAQRQNRKALGFVMATYRKRLTSSFYAIQKSLERRLVYIGDTKAGRRATILGELRPEEKDYDDIYNEEAEQEAYREDSAFIPDLEEEAYYVTQLLGRLGSLTSDTKLDRLRETLDDIFMRGVEKVIIFTQYYDTLEYLRDALSAKYQGKIVCYSGKGGEVWEGFRWKLVSTDDAVKAFQKDAWIMVSTEAGSEGKNFQFCNVIINYDLPWNPMRVEQRIGRIDRIGQKRDVEIHNMFFKNTIDGEVYDRLRKRIHLFETVVGPLHPILEKVEKYALQYPKGEALVKISGELEEIERQHKRALNIEERAQEFLFSGFDKSLIARFGVTPPVQPEDVRSFIQASSIALNGEIKLEPGDVEDLYRLSMSDAVLREIQLGGVCDIEREFPVVFRPDVAESLSAEDPRFQDVRLMAHGSPILNFLLERWKAPAESRFTALKVADVAKPSFLFLYKAKLEGLLRKEEIVPILVDLDSLEAREVSSKDFLRQLEAVATSKSGIGTTTLSCDFKEHLEVKIDRAIEASKDLWSELFDSLNSEWVKEDQDEYERRRRILDNSLNRIYFKAKSGIEVQVRRSIALKYIQQYPNVDRLPDGIIDVGRIAGAIEHSSELRDVFPAVGLDPSDLHVRGDEVKREARSFRTLKQRQALHLQILRAEKDIRSEYEKYRKMADRISSRKAELEKQRGRQATHTLTGAVLLLPRE